MEEMIQQYARLAGEIGLAGGASYALVRVWHQMIAQADQHRVDTANQDAVHRDEIKEIERQHREAMMLLSREHRDNMSELVQRNMDEHRERNRVQVMLGMEVARSLASIGVQHPNPYDNFDAHGREIPKP